MGAGLGSWVWATAAVLVLVAATATIARWFLRKVGSRRGPVRQVGQWRVAPDASVRAVQVLDRVHVIYEHGRQSSLLETRAVPDFSRALAEIEGPGRAQPQPAKAMVARA